MRLEIIGENTKKDEEVLRCEFRRDSAEMYKNFRAYLILNPTDYGSGTYAVYIDTREKTFRVRKGQVEALGLRVIIE